MVRSDTDFWYGKNVLITGGDGFVASNLAATLVQHDANVTITLRHQRAVPTLKILGKGGDLPDMEFSDLSEFLAVQKLCNRHKIDTIFHIAASAIVSDASRSPISTFENNFLSTLNILETARINQIPRVLFASSDKSYGDHADADDPERLPYREDQALRGLDVYSASKVCADMMCQTYAFQFKLPVLIVRSCNIYGPGDLNFTRLIPRTILRLRSDSVPVINAGNSEVLREYIYVDDLVEAYCFLAQHVEKHYKGEIPKKGRATYGWAAYNVGSYQGSFNPKDCPNIRNVSQVIQDIMQKMGKTHLKPEIIPKDVNFIEIPDQYIDASKIMKLGYKTKVSWNEGLEHSIKWYQDHGDYLSRLGSSYIK
jgi:CDP-glucose 4,6-dehydratase